MVRRPVNIGGLFPEAAKQPVLLKDKLTPRI